jgi:hypothetical protein
MDSKPLANSQREQLHLDSLFITFVEEQMILEGNRKRFSDAHKEPKNFVMLLRIPKPLGHIVDMF